MPKANDPLCPLGFHPQTRWPNRCKRCFRDYNDHQSVKNQSGSNTSLNSLSSYDSSTKSPREEYEVYKRSRSDMTAEMLARVNEDPSSSSSSKDRDSRGGGGSSSSSSSKLTSWNKARPTSWSAQDLRAAVDEAKEQIRSSREDLHRLYGSTKSLTTRDLGSLGDLRDSSSDLTTDSSSTPYSSFSSYLAMRTKSPARPPLARTSSLQGTTSTSSTVRREEEESKKLKDQASEESSYRTKLSSTDSTTTSATTKPRSSLLSTSLLENKTSFSSSSSTPSKSSLSSIAEGKKSSLSTTTSSSSNSTSSSEAKPPKPPSRLKTTGSKLGDISEAPKEEKPRKNILSLRGDLYNSSEEVKSEDDSVDASYVIQLAKPKKEPKRVEIDLQSEVDRLHKELKEKVQEVKEFEERVQVLEREKKELSSKRSVFGGDVRKHTELSRMQQKVDDLNDDMKSKNKEIKDLKKEIEKRPLPKDVEKTMEDLRSKLQAAEQLCEELMDENEEYKKEVKALEDEIEEMQDNFREEQADEYRDLKRELEQTAKNCRVLQFKLKKAERRSDMLERDKSEIDDKLKELQVGESDVQKAEKIKYLEKEVNLAKEVSMKMHDEMEKMKQQLEEAEKDKKMLTEKFKDQPIKPGGKYSRSQMMGRQGSQDNTDQLMRDLQDAGEREQDLKDQLKFAEEETKNLRKKLSRVEEENETLALQLKKMSNKAKADRQRSLERSGSLERASSVERGQLSRQGSTEKPPVKEPDEGITEDLDPTELKIQLELNEQEAAVLRRKVEDLESENERLQREIKGVLSSADLRTKKGDSSGDSQRLEKEADLLRTKIGDMEQENEKLLEENKRLQLKAVKRLPLSGSESSYIERQVMEDKVRRLEKKLKESNDKLKNAQLNASSSSVAGNNIDGKAKGSNDVALEGLKKEVTEKDGEITDLRAKLKDLQEACDKVTKECEDMKNASAYRDRTPKKPKDLTPKATLIKWVEELESECATLNVKLKFLETEKQVLEEMNKGKRDSNSAIDGEMCHLLFTERENLLVENKSLKERVETKESDARLQKRKVRELEMEKSKLSDQIKAFKEKEGKIKDVRAAGDQKSKLSKISDFTPKSVLKQMVDELSDECARLHVALMDTDKSKKGRPASEDLTSLRDLEDKLERERERNDELSRQLKEEREKLDNKPLANRRKAGGQDDDVRRLEERVESLKKDLAKEKEKNEELKAKAGSAAGVGFEEHRAAQTEKHKLQKELAAAQQTAASLEKKLKEFEDNLKYTEKSEREAKLALEKLQFKLDEEKTSVSQAEERQKELTTSWLKEREEMRDELSEFKKAKEKAERDLRLAKKARDSLETKFEDEKKRANEADSKKKREADEIKTLKNENRELSNEVDDLRNKVLQMEKNQGTTDTKQKKEVETLRLEKQGLEIRMATLESELKTEQKKRERLEKEKEKTSSLVMYKDTAERAESDIKKLKKEMESSKQDYEDKIKTLEKKNAVDKQELADLQNKYELLEEEFVVQKAQYTTALENKELSTARENNQHDYAALKKDHDTIEIELRTLRETYNLRQDTWIKEKLDMQEQLKSLEDRFNKVSLDPASYSEKKRLMDIIDDKNQQLERYRRDEEAIKDQVSYYRRESEELRRKVEDFEKLQELSERKDASRPTKDTSGYDTTIRELRSKLSSVEKTNKTELTKLKMKYDSKMKAMTEEVSTLTQHMTKYRRERDTYKEMLDGAQRSLAEMKGNTNFRTSRADAASERGSVQRQMDLKAQQHLQETQELQSQVTEFEDKLADAKIENAKMKNDLIDQKTNYEIQLCDLQTKLNEYEEDRLLVGGSRRVPGLRTRLELNWQKEREEQQRLIQETATLAKDLRQTLYEVERERDLERLESKRKIDQLKKTVGQESSDTKSKVQELQRDLLELREAHAKLRQINEKLRREKDRTEVEREAMRDKFLGTSREHLNQQTKMERLSDEMKLVKDLAPLVLGEGIDGRDSSLTRLPGEPKPRTKEEFTDALKKACRTMDEMKRMYNLFDDKDRLKRAPSFRRALSDLDTDDEGPPLRPRSAQRGGLKPLSKGQKSTLYRKTQSLDHQMAEDRGKIWVSTDAGSTTSIDSTMTDDMRRAKYDRDVSLDRISTGSQTSDLDSIAGEKKKKGLKGVMSKFGKSRSIEESGTGRKFFPPIVKGLGGLKAMGVGVGGSGSDIPTDVEKDSVKGKLKGLFKKGPPSRSQRQSPNGICDPSPF
ncbi:trichohyalin-like [Macrobrachium nipponense]|uniref:trichohyalin-like n=1 Tax=Macrobrachium nipponense TaxID=159736 RepID=UPI0030C8489D